MIASQADDLANSYTIAAVDRAIQLLEILGRNGPSSLATLAREASCTRTAAFRLLRTMAARGFAVQDGPRGTWRLGARLGALREAAEAQGALVITLAPRLTQLARDTGEVVYLLARRGTEAETLSIHQTNPKARRYGAPGTRRPLHAGAGRMLLATAPDVIQSQILTLPLPRHTPSTMVDPPRLAGDLARVRARGWLITDSELEIGRVSISVPVHDTTGAVPACVSIIGPAMRLRGPRARELLPQVIAAATDMSRMLGWNDRRAPAMPIPRSPNR